MEKETKPTVIEQTFDCLKNHKLETYAPGQHIGDCVSEYVVVQDAGNVNTTNNRVKTKTINVLCYVPANRYFRLEYLKEQVLDALRELYPMLIETGNESAALFDTSVNGWTQSIEYENFRQIKYFK